VLIFSYALPEGGGKIKFQKPTEFLKEHDTFKYYYQVGIYLDGRELPINAQTSMNYLNMWIVE
jgi:hypothetical protein